MTYAVTTHVRRWARITHSGRDGITVRHLRDFLAECDRADIPDDAKVRLESKLASEGANRSGYIEASVEEKVGPEHNHADDVDCYTGCPVYDSMAATP